MKRVDQTIMSGQYKGLLSNKIGYIKKNGYVNVRMWGTGMTQSAGTWITLATLPEGYRPYSIAYGTAVFGNNGQYPALARVDTDGSIQTYCNTAITNQAVCFNLICAVDE